MNSLPKLNFPAINLRATRNGNRTLVFDSVRQIYVVLTPEEWVRRHIVEYMLSDCGFLSEQIVEEYPVNINGMSQRADIVAIGNDAKPKIVVECNGEEILSKKKKKLCPGEMEYVTLKQSVIKELPADAGINVRVEA